MVFLFFFLQIHETPPESDSEWRDSEWNDFDETRYYVKLSEEMG